MVTCVIDLLEVSNLPGTKCVVYHHFKKFFEEYEFYSQQCKCGVLFSQHCLLFTVYCLLFTVYCLLFTVYCLLFTVYCLLFQFCVPRHASLFGSSCAIVDASVSMAFFVGKYN